MGATIEKLWMCEEDLRFYIKYFYADLHISEPSLTQITGTPDIIVREGNKVRLIELKIRLSNIRHQIRKGKMDLINEIWFIDDDTSGNLKTILKGYNVKLIDISSLIIPEHLKEIQYVHNLAREYYQILQNHLYAPHLIDITPLMGVLEEIGLGTNRYVFNVDKFMDVFYDEFRNDRDYFLFLEKTLEEYNSDNEMKTTQIQGNFKSKQ